MEAVMMVGTVVVMMTNHMYMLFIRDKLLYDVTKITCKAAHSAHTMTIHVHVCKLLQQNITKIIENWYVSNIWLEVQLVACTVIPYNKSIITCTSTCMYIVGLHQYVIVY